MKISYIAVHRAFTGARIEYPDDWSMPLGECGDEPAAEAFLTLVEEEYKTRVKDGKHLQKLTGIHELIGHEVKIKLGTPAAREEARRQMDALFTDAATCRYRRALDEILYNGSGKYKDLLAINPADYGLAEEVKTKEIRQVICFWASLNEGSLFRPDLQTVAAKLDAPYSEIWEAAEMHRY